MLTLMDSFLGITLVWATLILYFVYRRLTRPSISEIPGPEPESFLLGNLRQLFQEQAADFDFKWQDKFGGVFRIKAPFGEDRLMISDPRALQYIFQTSGYDIIKQPERKELSRLLTGRGLIWAEGDIHKRQRKVMAPAFGAAEARSLLPLFSQSADNLVSKWKDVLNESADQSAVFNIPSWMGRATMDAIGIAAFDFNFGCLDNADNELAQAYNNILQETHGRASSGRIFFQGVSYLIPLRVLEWVTDHGQAKPIVRAREVTAMANKMAKELIDTKSKALLQGKGNRDIMSLIVKANASENAKSRLTEDEMFSQMRTVMLAGYETTSNSLSWTLLELAKNRNTQSRLRTEIKQTEAAMRSRGDTSLSATDFDNMPYTIAVIKESLRMHPVAHQIYRQTSKDDVFPLSKPITTRTGKVIHDLHVPKGLRFVVAIAAYNRNEDVWGESAHMFDPNRWMDDSNGGRNKQAAPVGVYGNLMTFAGGVRSCIGWRFAVAEMQAFLVELVKEFEFSLTDETKNVRRDVALVMVPTVEGQADKGIQLPLKVTFATSE